jgi:hypothetical protein
LNLEINWHVIFFEEWILSREIDFICHWKKRKQIDSRIPFDFLFQRFFKRSYSINQLILNSKTQTLKLFVNTKSTNPLKWNFTFFQNWSGNDLFCSQERWKNPKFMSESKHCEYFNKQFRISSKWANDIFKIIL